MQKKRGINGRIESTGNGHTCRMGYVRIEAEAGGAAFSIRQAWTDTRENAGREGESSSHGERTAKRKSAYTASQNAEGGYLAGNRQAQDRREETRSRKESHVAKRCKLQKNA